MTEDELWHPGVDPNAETQHVGPAGHGAPILPRQPGPREAASLAETRLSVPAWQEQAGDGGRGGYEREWPEPGEARIPERRGVRRRRVLFAAGGMMLLAGGGVAAAMETRGNSGGPLASPAGSSTPTGSGSRTPSASASPAGTSSSPSASASSSPSPSSSNTQIATAPQWYVDNEGAMAIALTMDDGPSAEYTPQVLEVLRDYGVKATFNMIGQQVGSNLSLVREVSAEGHTITNHTWNHADLSHLTVTQVLSQIDRCNDALANANQNPTIFRAPYGNWSHSVFEACAERNLRPVGWSVDPRDWDTEHVTTEMIVQNVMEHTHAHDIILEHDGPTDRAHTVAALKIFIPRLLEKGFNFVAM